MAFWRKALLTVGLAGALSGAPAQAEVAENSTNENRTENVSKKPRTGAEVTSNSDFRVFFRTYELGAMEMIPGKFDSHVIPRSACNSKKIEKYYHEAHFNPIHNVAVVNQYRMSDENAFKRGLETFSNQRASVTDLSAALKQFNAVLADLKLAEPIKENGKTIKTYNDAFAKTLAEVQEILANKGMFKTKDAERLNQVAFETGLNFAIDIQQDIANINKKNASQATVGHEFGHFKVSQVIKDMREDGKFLTDLTPQDLFLFHMADEMAQYMHYDKKGMDPNEAMKHFRSDKESNYLNTYETSISAETIESATYKQWLKQNMNIVQMEGVGTVVDSEAYEQNSQKLLNEILGKIFEEKELQAVKNEISHCRSTHAYKYLFAQYNNFIGNLQTDDVERAKENVISQQYLKKLLETQEKTQENRSLEANFFNGLEDKTDLYLDVMSPKVAFLENEFSHARDLVARREGKQDVAQATTSNAKTFVLTNETLEAFQRNHFSNRV